MIRILVLTKQDSWQNLLANVRGGKPSAPVCVSHKFFHGAVTHWQGMPFFVPIY